MIKIDIMGRLGNQLFQYAFAYAAAKRLNTDFILHYYDHKDHLTNTCPLIIDKYFKLFKYRQTPYLITSKDNKFKIKEWNNLLPPELIMSNLEDNCRYQGFFQSEKYFKEVSRDLKKEFQVKKKFRKEFDIKFGDFFKVNKTIIIHVRRGDYMDWNINEINVSNPFIDINYYTKFLNSVSNLNDYKVIFLGDDLKHFEDIFGSHHMYLKNSEIIDFLLIMNADVICLSNSTFCWWGAYLNPKENKEIYAPEFWLGFKSKTEYPNSIIPPEWNIIAIR
jgi:hypothetical protein